MQDNAETAAAGGRFYINIAVRWCWADVVPVVCLHDAPCLFACWRVLLCSCLSATLWFTIFCSETRALAFSATSCRSCHLYLSLPFAFCKVVTTPTW
jgi:hypothetical protein